MEQRLRVGSDGIRDGRRVRRREVIAGGTAAFAGSVLDLTSPVWADMQAAMHEAMGEGPITKGRVRVDLPALAETGHSVPLSVSVDSPMTSTDHVRSIYVFSPENPLPNVARFHLTARSGKAQIETSIRLATTQIVHVVAVMSDGTRWLGTAEVDVTTAACFDPT